MRATEPNLVLLRLKTRLLAQQRQARRCLKRLQLSQPASFHNLRVTLKWLRYGCEFLASLQIGAIDRGRARLTADRCRDLQQELGAIQDDVVLLGFVEQSLQKHESVRAPITRRQEAAMQRVLAMNTDLQALLREAHHIVVV